MKRLALLILCLIWLVPTLAYANQLVDDKNHWHRAKVPCSVDKRKRKQRSCFEYGLASHTALLAKVQKGIDRIDTIKLLRIELAQSKVVEEKLKGEIALQQKNAALDQRELKNRKEQLGLVRQRNTLLDRTNRELRDKLNSVWRHPMFWLGMGLVVGGVVTGVVVAVRNAGQASGAVQPANKAQAFRIPKMNDRVRDSPVRLSQPSLRPSFVLHLRR